MAVKTPSTKSFWSRLPVAAQAATALLGAGAAFLAALVSFTNTFAPKPVTAEPRAQIKEVAALQEQPVSTANEAVGEKPAPVETTPAETAKGAVAVAAETDLPNKTFPYRAVFRAPNMREVDLMAGPEPTSGAVGVITRDDRLFAGEEKGIWVHISTSDGRVGYLRKDYVVLVDRRL